jgi:hypothetical protein
MVWKTDNFIGGGALQGFTKSGLILGVTPWFDNNLYAFSRVDGSVVWSFGTGERLWSAPAVDATGNIYFAGADKFFYCLDENGKLKWKFQLGSSSLSSPCITKEGTVVVGCDDGNVYAFNASGANLWKYSLPIGIRSCAATDEQGSIYVTSDKSLTVLSPTGQLLRTVPAGSDISPVVDAKAVYFIGQNGSPCAYDKAGKLLWQSSYSDVNYLSMNSLGQLVFRSGTRLIILK